MTDDKLIDKEEMQRRVEDDEDFIALKKFKYSLAYLKQCYPDGSVPLKVSASALLVSEKRLKSEYERIVLKLRRMMLPGEDIES